MNVGRKDWAEEEGKAAKLNRNEGGGEDRFKKQ